MPCGKQIGRSPRQFSTLIAKEVQRKAGIQLRVVHAPALESAILVVLDEAVIGIAGKSEWTETQRIHRRQFSSR